MSEGDIYKDATHHNVVFVDRDKSGISRCAHSKGTIGHFRTDVSGSDKSVPFCFRGEGNQLFAFEARLICCHSSFSRFLLLASIKKYAKEGRELCSYVENEQKAQAGMAAFLKSPKPHDIQFALPEMCPRPQAELPGHHDGLPALSIQTGQKEKPLYVVSLLSYG